MHVLFHLAFAVGLLWFLSRELGIKFIPKQHAKWLIYGAIAGIFAALVHYYYPNKSGNFVLHSVGGGVATAFTYHYLKLHTRVRFKWYIDLLILFMFVSTFGVLNELYEYAVELSGLMISALDTHDTWRDMVANTLGALVAWLAVNNLIKK